MGRADVPRDGPPSDPQREIGDDEAEVPVAVKQPPPSGVEDLGRRSRRVDEPVDQELRPPVDRPVPLAEVLDELVRDPGGDVVREPGRHDDAQDGSRLRPARRLPSRRHVRVAAGCAASVSTRSPSLLSSANCAAPASISNSSSSPSSVDGDLVAGLEPAAEHHPRELVLDQALDRPPQRAGAELRVEALAREQLDRLVAELDLDPLRAQPPCQPVEQQLRDLGQLLVGEGPEDDDLVDPVDELRPEALRSISMRSSFSSLEVPAGPRVLPGSGRRRGSRS